MTEREYEGPAPRPAPAPVGQERLFRESPDRNMAGVTHRDAGATERAAAERVAPRTGTARRSVLDAFIAAGEDGLTDYEIHVKTGLRHYTAAPRRNELLRDGWIVDSGRRRATDSGSPAVVWVIA